MYSLGVCRTLPSGFQRMMRWQVRWHLAPGMPRRMIRIVAYRLCYLSTAQMRPRRASNETTEWWYVKHPWHYIAPLVLVQLQDEETAN